MAIVAFWTQPIATAIDFSRLTIRSAIETGDLTFACYGMLQSVAGLLLRNDPLDAVWRESEMALDFAREAKYGDAVDIIVSQQRFISTMQGRTATFSTYSDAHFDEATLEAQLTGDRMTLTTFWYWILKLKARFLSGDYAGALGKVKQLDELYPHLHKERDSTSPIATIGTSVAQLDIETVIKSSQALSSEIVLRKLIEKLMRIAVEHAGAERGLLVLLRGD